MLPTQFSYERKRLRMFIKNGEPYYCAADFCSILEISNPTDAVKRLKKDELDLIEVTDSLGRQQITNGVNETGIYSLILGTRKPEAKAFKRWITHDVIPAIRKTGSYSAQLTPAEALLRSVELLAKQERELNAVKEAQTKSQEVLVKHEFALTTLDQKVRVEITLLPGSKHSFRGRSKQELESLGIDHYFPKSIQLSSVSLAYRATGI